MLETKLRRGMIERSPRDWRESVQVTSHVERDSRTSFKNRPYMIRIRRVRLALRMMSGPVARNASGSGWFSFHARRHVAQPQIRTKFVNRYEAFGSEIKP